MAIICPTITTNNLHTYRQQIEGVAVFAPRIHIDLADGLFTPNELIAIDKIWWPENVSADIHLMYKDPDSVIDKVIAYKPNLVIFHAEASGNFDSVAGKLSAAGVRVGVALLAKTEVSLIGSKIDLIDHVLIFSGDLGHFGGHADLSLLGKVSELKALKPKIEIGWDGGINDENAAELAGSGVNVLNVGGFIQKATRPDEAYAKLKQEVGADNE